MNEPRSSHDERVVTVENERTTLARALQHIQNDAHYLRDAPQLVRLALYAINGSNNVGQKVL